MLASYLGDPKKADRTQQEARFELADLAMDQPTLCWEFIEHIANSSASYEELRGLGHDALYWLLRRHPDYYDKRIAGLVRRDDRFRRLIDEIDPDRIAPDVWRQIEAARVEGAGGLPPSPP